MSGAILTLNAGSSSLKFALFDDDADRTETMRGAFTNLDTAPEFSARDGGAKIVATCHFAAGTRFIDLVSHLLEFADHRLAGGPLFMAASNIACRRS
jgi:acetate kinase